jgi:hypothetical protein
MAVREFHATLKNSWDNPLVRTADDVDGGQWQEPFLPSQVPGAGRIEPSLEGEWRSESDGVAKGTSGWARWATRVVDPFENPSEHFEWFQVNWSVPFLGKPDLTWGTTRIDPASSDAFATVDSRPPTLEIVPTRVNNDDIPSDGVVQLALYFFALPASFLVHLIPSISEIDANFVVRRRASATQSSLSFPTGLPSREQLAMAAFHNRMQSAASLGFIGAFPTFQESVSGRDHLGGTILIRPAGGEFHNVSLAKLGNVSLTDFVGRIRAANKWAATQVVQTGIKVGGGGIFEPQYAGAFPTFFHANDATGIGCGTIAIKAEAAESRDVPKSQLNNVAEGDFEGRFRATQDYARKNGFVGGFPTFIDGPGLVLGQTVGEHPHTEMLYGTVLLRVDHSMLGGRTDTFAAKRDLVLFRDPA